MRVVIAAASRSIRLGRTKGSSSSTLAASARAPPGPVPPVDDTADAHNKSDDDQKLRHFTRRPFVEATEHPSTQPAEGRVEKAGAKNFRYAPDACPGCARRKCSRSAQSRQPNGCHHQEHQSKYGDQSQRAKNAQHGQFTSGGCCRSIDIDAVRSVTGSRTARQTPPW